MLFATLDLDLLEDPAFKALEDEHPGGLFWYLRLVQFAKRYKASKGRVLRADGTPILPWMLAMTHHGSRRQADEWARFLDLCIELGLLVWVEEEQCFKICNWKRWHRPPSANPEAVAERVKNHRLNRGDVTPRYVTSCNEDVTRCNEPKRAVTNVTTQSRAEHNITKQSTPSLREESEEGLPPLAPSGGGEKNVNGRREDGSNPRAQGTNPRANGTNPRARATNPKAQPPPIEPPEHIEAELPARQVLGVAAKFWHVAQDTSREIVRAIERGASQHGATIARAAAREAIRSLLWEVHNVTGAGKPKDPAKLLVRRLPEHLNAALGHDARQRQRLERSTSQTYAYPYRWQPPGEWTVPPQLAADFYLERTPLAEQPELVQPASETAQPQELSADTEAMIAALAGKKAIE